MQTIKNNSLRYQSTVPHRTAPSLIKSHTHAHAHTQRARARTHKNPCRYIKPAMNSNKRKESIFISHIFNARLASCFESSTITSVIIYSELCL